MKNLKFTYLAENNQTKSNSYNTIMDFVDAIDMTGIDISTIQSSNVVAIFYENTANSKKFKNLKDLYDYCKNMLNPNYK